MFSTAEDRPTRKLKKENRFYNFLNRSRSRSRPLPDTNTNPSRTKSDSKPPHRIPSRPLATVTITPSNEQSNSKRKINLFGISFPRSCSRSRSRPGTPRLSLDIPPLPSIGFEEPAPSASRSASPFPTTKPSQEKHPSVNAADSSGASKLKGLFSGPARPKTSIPVVSAPSKRISSSQRQSLKPTATPLSPSSPIPAIPKIIHTPATPVRAATAPVKSSTSSTSAGHNFKNRSLDTGYRYRATMDAVNEEGRLSKEIQMEKQLTRSSKGKGKEKENENENEVDALVLRTGLTKMSTSARNTKHGSFDFERPGWGAVMIQRTGSNGTSTSRWSKSGNGEVVIRESILGPGLAGVGTIQREVSMKRAKESQEKSKELERQVKDTTLSTKSKSVKTPSTTVASPPQSSNGHHTPPSASGHSSLGKASGKRLIGASNGSSRGHGLFSFEPPVPSPTWSTNTASTTKETSASWGGQSEKERERIQRERERQKDKKPQKQRDRSPVPVPSLSTGHRSGSKGRSLDLNLGLAWAPSRVKESALLPSSQLFRRTSSNSSSVKSTVSRSANSSAHGHGQESSSQAQYFTSEERSRVGREVADMFRIALGEARYSRFKTYIHQFDAHEIPFDGPNGIIAKVDGLLTMVPSLPFEEKRQLMDKLVRIILQTA